MLEMKNIGKPYALVAHVRFDEGELLICCVWWYFSCSLLYSPWLHVYLNIVFMKSVSIIWRYINLEVE